MAAESITCPRCGMTSWHPKDVEEGYCGHCHAWTALDDEVIRGIERLTGEKLIRGQWIPVDYMDDM